MRHAKVAAAAAASVTPPAKKRKEACGTKEASGLSRKMHSFLEEQEAIVVGAITACQETQSQLDQYQTTLTDWDQQQQQLENRLQELIDQICSARQLVQQEKSRAVAKKEKLKKREQELQAVLEVVRTPRTEQGVGAVMSKVFRCTGEAEQLLEECRASIPDAGTVATITKVSTNAAPLLSVFTCQTNTRRQQHTVRRAPCPLQYASCGPSVSSRVECLPGWRGFLRGGAVHQEPIHLPFCKGLHH